MKYCDLETLQCLYKNNIIRFGHDKMLYFAVLSNYKNVLKYIIEKGCPITNTLMMVCAKHDKLAHLKYSHKIYNMFIDRNIINAMLKHDSIKCLKYVHRINVLNSLDFLELQNIGKNCGIFISEKFKLKNIIYALYINV